MKKSFLPTAIAAAMLISISPVIFAMGKRMPAPTPAPTPAEGRAKIVFDETTYDFGELSGVPKVEHVFAFHNRGTDALKIGKVKTTCGCTAALLSSKEIPPGEEGDIKVTFTVGSRQGKQVKRIYVHSNDPETPQARLEMRGTIIPLVEVQPRSVNFYDAKGAPTKTVKISQTTEEELALKDPSTRLGLVSAALREEPSGNGKKRYLLDISVKPDIQPGRYFERVTIATNNKNKPQIQIPVRINVRGEIEVAPRRLNLGALKPGQTITRSFTIANRKKEPFSIVKTDVNNKDFSLDLKTPTKSLPTHPVTVSYTAGEKQGAVKARIVFETDYEKQKKVEAHVYGFIRSETPRIPPAGKAAPPK